MAEITWAVLLGQGQSLRTGQDVKLPRVPPLQPSEGNTCEIDGQKNKNEMPKNDQIEVTEL